LAKKFAAVSQKIATSCPATFSAHDAAVLVTICHLRPNTLCMPVIELLSRCYDIIRPCRRHLPVFGPQGHPRSLLLSNLMGNSCQYRERLRDVEEQH